MLLRPKCLCLLKHLDSGLRSRGVNRLLAILPIILLASTLILSTSALGQGYPIRWSQSQVSTTLGDGHTINEPAEVTFGSTRYLSNVAIFVTPSLQGFVSVTPDHFENVQPNVTYSISLRFALPPHVQPGMYEGTLHLRVGKATLAQNLKLSIDVNFGRNVASPDAETLSITSQDLLTSVSVNGGVTTLQFSQWNDDFGVLTPGKILVLPPLARMPDGFIGKIHDVTLSNGAVYISAEPASLAEVFASADISFVKHLTDTSGAVAQYTSAVSRKLSVPAVSGNVEQGFFFKVDNLSLGEGLRIDGTVLVDPTVEFNCTIDAHQLVALRFVNHISATENLFVRAGLTETVRAKVLFPGPPLPRITVYAAGFPVVITPKLEPVIGADGRVFLGTTTGITDSFQSAAGIDYRDGNWTTVHTYENSFGFDPPRLSAALNVKFYAGTQLTLLAYGIAGPYLTIDAFGNLDADVFRTPWWQLYAGLEASAGAELRILDETLADISFPAVIGYRVLLAEAPAPQQPTVTTLDATEVTPTSAVLSGTVNPAGNYGTAFFEYGPDPTLQTPNITPPQSLPIDFTVHQITESLLFVPATTTYFRLAFRTGGGELIRGATLSITTPAPPPPSPVILPKPLYDQPLDSGVGVGHVSLWYGPYSIASSFVTSNSGYLLNATAFVRYYNCFIPFRAFLYTPDQNGLPGTLIARSVNTAPEYGPYFDLTQFTPARWDFDSTSILPDKTAYVLVMAPENAPPGNCFADFLGAGDVDSSVLLAYGSSGPFWTIVSSNDLRLSIAGTKVLVDNLGQYTVGIPLGESLASRDASLSFQGSPRSSLGLTAKLQFQLRRSDQPFPDDTQVAESTFVPSGARATVKRDGLSDGAYLWRVRGVDEVGNASDWVEFGGADIVDFFITTVRAPAGVLYQQLDNSAGSNGVAGLSYWYGPYALFSTFLVDNTGPLQSIHAAALNINCSMSLRARVYTLTVDGLLGDLIATSISAQPVASFYDFGEIVWQFDGTTTLNADTMYAVQIAPEDVPPSPGNCHARFAGGGNVTSSRIYAWGSQNRPQWDRYSDSDMWLLIKSEP